MAPFLNTWCASVQERAKLRRLLRYTSHPPTPHAPPQGQFPLHFIVFKQTACHLGHEANVEQLFSRSGNLTDPNIDPHFLGKLTSIGVNKSRFQPSTEAIKKRYFAKYRGKAGEHDEGEQDEGSSSMQQ